MVWHFVWSSFNASGTRRIWLNINTNTTYNFILLYNYYITIILNIIIYKLLYTIFHLEPLLYDHASPYFCERCSKFSYDADVTEPVDQQRNKVVENARTRNENNLLDAVRLAVPGDESASEGNIVGIVYYSTPQ